MQQNLQQKKGLVKSVFDTVYNKYDLMNDFMSFGIHRYWKRELIRQINPSSNNSLIDVACGTGDVAKLFSDINQNKSKILCVDFISPIFIEVLFKEFSINLYPTSFDGVEYQWHSVVVKVINLYIEVLF